MGVPAFFRWLANRYPRVMPICRRRNARKFDRHERVTRERDVGRLARWVQVDNLFIDCNGVALPAVIPRTGAAAKNEEMLDNVGKYFDRLVAGATDETRVSSSRWLRAGKMNQQRERACSARKLRKARGHGRAEETGAQTVKQALGPQRHYRDPFMDSLASYCRTLASKAVAKQPSFGLLYRTRRRRARASTRSWTTSGPVVKRAARGVRARRGPHVPVSRLTCSESLCAARTGEHWKRQNNGTAAIAVPLRSEVKTLLSEGPGHQRTLYDAIGP